MISTVRYVNLHAYRTTLARDKREAAEQTKLMDMSDDPRRNHYTGQICAVFVEEEYEQ